jgi:halogenation protein CepH
MQPSHEPYDLIVIGGGPAGSSLASFVAMDGHRVLLLEKDRFPRHQIGESLLPATVHGICAMLGVRDDIEKAGFPRKNGGTFRWGKNSSPWTFRFTRRPNDPYGYAYQVERSKFDKILLDNSRKKGVDVREGHEVTGVLREDGRIVGVRYRDDQGTAHAARARYAADASGNRTRVSQEVGERVYSKFFQNVALYGYFESGKRLPPPNSGNILLDAFKHGWLWYIPLSNTLTSVGAVVSRDVAGHIQEEGFEKALFGYIDQCSIIKDFLAKANRVKDGIYGELRVRKDYSYCNTRFWAPGAMLIGDAACFIDPVFSSGVHLCTYSALVAARSINTCLRGVPSIDEKLCFEEFERRYRREFGRFYQFLVAFYDMHNDEDSYFWSARKVLNTEETANDAFIRLVAGLSAREEPLFDGEARQFFAERTGLGDWFEDMLQREAKNHDPRGAKAHADKAPRVDPKKFDPDQFMLGFSEEIANLQLQAIQGAARPKEMPMVAGGLIPSPCGLKWRKP